MLDLPAQEFPPPDPTRGTAGSVPVPELRTGLVGVPSTQNRRMRLHDGERLLVQVQPSFGRTFPVYLCTLGLYAFWRRRCFYALTDRRLIRYRGVITTPEDVVPLDAVQDIAVRVEPLNGGSLTVEYAGTFGQLHLKFLKSGEVRPFADAIQSAITTLRHPAPHHRERTGP